MGADTSKLASPTPERLAAAKHQLDMSFSDRSGPISQPEDQPIDLSSGEQNSEIMIRSSPKELPLSQHKDDKLTQSQMLKRMLEAEERDNQRDR